MSSPKRLARIAGLLYLIVGVFGGFAVGYVTARVYVPGDAATTAANVLSNAGLLRIGVVADLLQATVFVFLAYPENRFVQTLGVVTALLDTTYLVVLRQRQRGRFAPPLELAIDPAADEPGLVPIGAASFRAE